MEPTPTKPIPQRVIDVTGLPDEAIRAVELLVSLLRGQDGRFGSPMPPTSPVDWATALRDWAESHNTVANPVDWSRESIYAGRGK